MKTPPAESEREDSGHDILIQTLKQLRQNQSEAAPGTLAYMLEKQWEAIQTATTEPAPVFEREALVHDSISAYALTTVCELILNGRYPPPELMLALAAAWQHYMANGLEKVGKNPAVTLEDVFYGKPKQGQGHYACRVAKDFGQYRLTRVMEAVNERWLEARSNPDPTRNADLKHYGCDDAFMVKLKRYRAFRSGDYWESPMKGKPLGQAEALARANEAQPTEQERATSSIREFKRKAKARGIDL